VTANTHTETAAFTSLLPSDLRQVLDDRPAPGTITVLGRVPDAEELLGLYRRMMLDRAVEDAATAMAKQGNAVRSLMEYA
jgi:hypothetical protein